MGLYFTFYVFRFQLKWLNMFCCISFCCQCRVLVWRFKLPYWRLRHPCGEMCHWQQQAASSVGAGSGEAPSASPIHRDRWIVLESFTPPVSWTTTNRGRCMKKRLLLSCWMEITQSSRFCICLLYSSTWLNTQSLSLKASWKDPSISHLHISLMWALIHTTPGLFTSLYQKHTVIDFILL